MPTAILVDGDFFLRRYEVIYGRNGADRTASDLHKMCLAHLAERRNNDRSDVPPGPRRELYRIFFYDCPPLKKKAHHPLTGKSIDFSKTDLAIFRTQLHAELRKSRKVALRLGYLDERNAQWTIKPTKMKDILAGKLQRDALDEGDVIYYARQKGVDMRIGLDIASLAFKRQADQIVLIAGDSDFVPTAKLARREGIDFILDPMWHPIKEDLHEHIDGLRTVCPRPGAERATGATHPVNKTSSDAENRTDVSPA